MAKQDEHPQTLHEASERLNEACRDVFVKPLLPMLTRICDWLARGIEAVLLWVNGVIG